jgi:hypothetical protein
MRRLLEFVIAFPALSEERNDDYPDCYSTVTDLPN